MRTVKRTAQFKKDYKREAKGRHRDTLDDDLLTVVRLLAAGGQLPPRYHDHPLVGEWRDFRDCHIKPNLILIYRFDGDILQLVRLGSHSELCL